VGVFEGLRDGLDDKAGVTLRNDALTLRLKQRPGRGAGREIVPQAAVLEVPPPK
jgi:hypothetical protein